MYIMIVFLQGSTVFGKEGTEAIISELRQLHERSVLDPDDPKELSNEEKKVLLQYLMFLKKKGAVK